MLHPIHVIWGSSEIPCMTNSGGKESWLYPAKPFDSMWFLSKICNVYSKTKIRACVNTHLKNNEILKKEQIWLLPNKKKNQLSSQFF